MHTIPENERSHKAKRKMAKIASAKLQRELEQQLADSQKREAQLEQQLSDKEKSARDDEKTITAQQNEISRLTAELQSANSQLASIDSDPSVTAVGVAKDQFDATLQIVEAQSQTITSLEDKIYELKSYIPLLEVLAVFGMAIWARFFANTGLLSNRSQRVIEGNHAAHRGSPLADAILFEYGLPPCERNKASYLSMYGVSIEWANHFMRIPMVYEVLMHHGSLVAEKIELTTAFNEAFNHFIYQVDNDLNLDEGYKRVLCEYKQIVKGKGYKLR